MAIEIIGQFACRARWQLPQPLDDDIGEALFLSFESSEHCVGILTDGDVCHAGTLTGPALSVNFRPAELWPIGAERKLRKYGDRKDGERAEQEAVHGRVKAERTKNGKHLTRARLISI